MYHCFGCGVGGDAFRFVFEREALDFRARSSGSPTATAWSWRSSTRTRASRARRKQRDPLFALLDHTAAFYVRYLWDSDEAAGAREYLAARGLTRTRCARTAWATRRTPWDRRAASASRRAGYGQEELLAAGLIQPSRNRAGHIDRFRGRVTFPLTDVKGHVLGFGARAMKPDQQPKYLNTSDGEIFHKSQVVYGQDMARAAAAKAGRIVIVEGYTDVIALHQAGVPETVAQMGTALTEAAGRRDRPPGAEGAAVPGPGQRGPGVGPARPGGADGAE